MKACVFVRPVHHPAFPLFPAAGAPLHRLPGYVPTANPPDEQALEMALRLREAGAFPDLAVALCSAGERAPCERVLRDLLACGADEALWIHTPGGPPDGEALARCLVRAVAGPGLDLALFGASDSDTEAGQTGPMFGALAGIPYFGSVVALRAGPAGSLEITRREGRLREDIRLRPPVCLGVLRGSALRYPSFWGKRRARAAVLPCLRTPPPPSRVERVKVTGGKPRRTAGPRDDVPAGSAERMRQALGVAARKAESAHQIRGTPEEAARRMMEVLAGEKIL